MEFKEFYRLLLKRNMVPDFHTDTHIEFMHYYYPDDYDPEQDDDYQYPKVFSHVIDKHELAGNMLNEGWSIERIENWFSQVAEFRGQNGQTLEPFSHGESYQRFVRDYKENQALNKTIAVDIEDVDAGLNF